MNRSIQITFEGGSVNGLTFDLPAGTTEIHLAALLQTEEVYCLVVRDDGIFAVLKGKGPVRASRRAAGNGSDDQQLSSS